MLSLKMPADAGTCPGRGLQLPELDAPTPADVGASPACWALGRRTMPPCEAGSTEPINETEKLTSPAERVVAEARPRAARHTQAADRRLLIARAYESPLVHFDRWKVETVRKPRLERAD